MILNGSRSFQEAEVFYRIIMLAYFRVDFPDRTQRATTRKV